MKAICACAVAMALTCGAAAAQARTGVYGRVLRADGRPAGSAHATLYQSDKLREASALASFGFFCLLPAGCPQVHGAGVTAGGRYRYPRRQLQPKLDLQVAATLPRRAGQIAPTEVVTVLPKHRSPQRIPDLRFWEPVVSLHTEGFRITVRWPALTRSGDEPVEYSIAVATKPKPRRSLEPKLVAGPIAETSATVDGRLFEDLPTDVVVLARTTSGRIERRFRSGGRRIPTAGLTPLSRGRPCLGAGPSLVLRAARTPCPLTDGDFEEWVRGLELPGDTPERNDHQRECVDLGTPRPISMIVMRNVFPQSDYTIELSLDGTTFTSVGALNHIAEEFFDLPLDPPQQARIVCIREPDANGFVGGVAELSLW